MVNLQGIHKEQEMNLEEKIAEAIAGLKDFQLKTVEYAYDQLYVKNRNKLLIADEVGLGKTIVAKGIIAKGFEKYLADGGPTAKNPTYNVIYICSNLSLAKQNLRKLNFLGDNAYIDETVNRLIFLAYKPKVAPPKFLLQALTPGTSFDEKSHMGEIGERMILYVLLVHYAAFSTQKEELKKLLRGYITNLDYWYPKFDELFEKRMERIRPDLFAKFRKELREFKVTYAEMPALFAFLKNKPGRDLWHSLKRVCTKMDECIQKPDLRAEIIRIMRRILSRICLQYLGADIFILDEFQRYSNLIKLDEEAESPAIETARTVFRQEEAKTLMLSATPFKPYTNDFDELNGEVHYKELVNVLKFLLADKPDDFWKGFEKDRQAFFKFLRHPRELKDNLLESGKHKKNLEEIYRQCIVRTEKLMASNDPNALIRLVNKPLTIRQDDIQDFISLDRITLFLNEKRQTSLPAPVEYVKSSPFAMSFLDNYQHKKKIRQYIAMEPELKRLVRETKQGWVDMGNIHQYEPLIPKRGKSIPNAKLRLLLDETIANNGWKYLWIPPSIQYYPLEGAFSEGWGFSKTLLFSSWKLVPRMVSTLVSYEAERLSIGKLKSLADRERKENEGKETDKNRYYYFGKTRSPRPLFTFKVLKEDNGPTRMNNFILTYPSLFLARQYDPVENIHQRKTLGQILQDLKEQYIGLFHRYDLNRYVNGQGDWKKWIWMAPLLFDKATMHDDPQNTVSGWFAKGMPDSELSIDAESSTNDKDENSGKKRHFELAASVFRGQELLDAAYPDENQLDSICEHLALLTLASPATCTLRTLLRHHSLTTSTLDAAFNIASGFMTLFNKPESIAIVRIHHTEGDYHQKVLQYMADGNIQSVLDEYVYLLTKCENFHALAELSDYIVDILSVRTSRQMVDDYHSFITPSPDGKTKGKAMRVHYAVDFGNQKLNTANKSNRDINIRQAFNSPFRPFVLASTSIGQEGLDFHYYCKKIFHWNLPSNAIDFEQREGRINRYLGFVIRLNLADKYLDKIKAHNNANHIWDELLALSAEEKMQAKFPCELVPYWHTETNNDIRIERFVPLYPFSRDIAKYAGIMKTLAYYRLTFGQPRQQELIDALQGTEYTEDELKILDELIINLSPMKFYKNGE